MIGVTEALNIINETTPQATVEELQLLECGGRILAEPVRAERSGPPFDRVAMDGIAISLGEGLKKKYPVRGVQAAGSPPLSLNDRSCCFEVMTGAVLPAGCDCVLPYERVRIEKGDAYPSVKDPLPYSNVHRMGSDYEKGEELLFDGDKLSPAEIAIAASQGRSSLRVYKRPRVALVCTGDELVDAGAPIQPHQIRKSNVYAIAAALRDFCSPEIEFFHINDSLADSQMILGEILECFDVLVLSGGVSKGRYDFIPKALERIGVEKLFHRVSQRPGKPMYYGVKNKTQIFGLPGNPVSSLICARVYVLPSLAKVTKGRPEEIWVPLSETLVKNKALTFFVPGTLINGPDSTTTFRQNKHNGSGDFFGLKGARGFIEFKAEADRMEKGELARFRSWSQ